MWRYKRMLCAALCIITVALCVPCAYSAPEEASELTLLFTTDIHSNLVPHLALIDGKPARVGGYARLKSAVSANAREGKTLLLDSGDFSMGTLYQNFSVSDRLDLRLLDTLGYDAVALGNHDFEIGEDKLRLMLDDFRAEGGSFPLLAGNLIYSGEKKISEGQSGNPLGGQGVQNYAVIERAGLKIGLFSVMGDNAVSYTPTKQFAFADPVKSAESIVNTLRRKEDADIVIMLSHAGYTADGSFTEDADIARKVEGIDVILSGHTHMAMHEAVTVGDTIIACAGTALNYLGKMELRRENGVWKADYGLIPLDSRWKEDGEIAAMIGTYNARLDAGYLRSLGVMRDIMEDFAYCECDFYDGDAMLSSIRDYPFARLLSEAYFYALEQEGIDDAQVAMIPVGTVRAGLYKGKLKIMDAYNVLSYGASPVRRFERRSHSLRLSQRQRALRSLRDQRIDQPPYKQRSVPFRRPALQLLFLAPDTRPRLRRGSVFKGFSELRARRTKRKAALQGRDLLDLSSKHKSHQRRRLRPDKAVPQGCRRARHRYP